MGLSLEREGRLTASDHGSALGLNPYCSRQELWRKWNGLAEPHSEETLERFRWGHDHEKDAVGFYEVETGEVVTDCLDRQVFVPYEDWSGCTPDGFVGEQGLLECKCPTKVWDIPPTYYWLQVQSQLAITGRQWCALTAWTPEESRIWVVQTDTEYWPWAKPLLLECWKNLTTGMEPKKSKKPKIPMEVQWERIA